MSEEIGKSKEPSLELLQDVYTHHLHCDNNLSAQPGDNLRVLDDQIFELYINDETTKAATSRGGFISILKDFHLAALYRLKRVGEYIQGEYKATSEDEAFLNEFNAIHPEFIEGWYWRVIYIGYGEDLIELEKQALKKQQLPFKSNKCKFFSKFRIYTRVDTEGTANIGKYTSVLSGVTNLKIENERLIACSCNDGANWLQWWELVREYNAGNQKFIAAFNASIKRLSVMIANKDQWRAEAQQLSNNNIYLTKYRDQTKELNNNKEKTIEIISPELASQILNLNQAYFETQAAWFGFAGKGTNNKTERLTAAENYQTLKLISNIQEHNLKKLNVVAWQMKQVFKEAIPEDFKFEVSGQTMAMGVPESMNLNANLNNLNNLNQPVENN